MEFNSNILRENEVRIIKYLHGNLAKDKLKEFEEQLKQDAALRAQTQQVRNLIMVLGDPESIRMEGMLLDMREKNIALMENEPGPVKKYWRRLTSGTKAVVSLVSLFLFIALLALLVTLTKGVNASGFYWSDKKPYPVTFPTEALEDPTLKKAVTAYQEGDWDRAEPLFKALSDREATYKFYFIVTRLWKNPDDDSDNLERLKQFQEALKFEDDPYSRQLNYWAEYYTALIYFKQGQFDEGKRIIYDLNSNDDIYGSLKEAVGVIQGKIDDSWFLY